MIFAQIIPEKGLIHAFIRGSEVKASTCNAGDPGSIPGSGRSAGEGNGNPLQYSCLENPMERGAWWATVHGVTKSRTGLSDFTLSLSSGYDIHNILQFCYFIFEAFFLFFHEIMRNSLKLSRNYSQLSKLGEWCYSF